MNWRRLLYFNFLCALGITCAWAGSNWRQNVPQADRARVNPYAGQKPTIAAGAKLFREYCAQCHGKDALGTGSRPSLRTREVQQASDGELRWLLRNGERPRGMPSWNSLPEPSRWQIIAYIKSLGESGETEPSTQEQEGK